MSAPPVALVTGSSRGIGLHIARQLAATGHRLVLCARDGDRLAAVQRELGAASTAICAVDLQRPDAPAAAVASALQTFGSLSVLVNNAGTAPSDRLERTTDAMLQETFALHVRAPLALLREALPELRRQPAATVVNLASTAGLRGFPFTAAYTAAKHGMVGLSRAAAAELRGTAVRVYALCPGFVDTDITRNAAAAIAARGKTTVDEALARLGAQNRIGRMHSAAEVAAAVAWLVHDRPDGCVYDLDRPDPCWVDGDEQQP